MSKIRLPENVRVGNFVVPAGTEIEIEGGTEEVMLFLKRIGQPHAFHYSETKKEFIHVSQMDTAYLRNVIAKHYVDFAEKIRAGKTAKEVVSVMEDGDPAAQDGFRYLLHELSRRATSA